LSLSVVTAGIGSFRSTTVAVKLVRDFSELPRLVSFSFQSTTQQLNKSTNYSLQRRRFPACRSFSAGGWVTFLRCSKKVTNQGVSPEFFLSLSVVTESNQRRLTA
jgi:hypothetical protein